MSVSQLLSEAVDEQRVQQRREHSALRQPDGGLEFLTARTVQNNSSLVGREHAANHVEHSARNALPQQVIEQAIPPDPVVGATHIQKGHVGRQTPLSAVSNNFMRVKIWSTVDRVCVPLHTLLRTFQLLVSKFSV